MSTEPTESVTNQKTAEETFYDETKEEAKETKDGEPSSKEVKESEESSKEEAKEDESSKEERSKETSEDKSKEEPKDYELSLDEKSLITKDSLDRIAAYAKEQGLSKEQAEKLLGSYEQTLKDYDDLMAKNLEDQRRETAENWVKELKKDEEFGGANFEKNVELARKGTSKVFSESFAEVLEHTGLGNNPDFVKGMKIIGEMISDDSFVHGKHMRDQKPKTAEEIFFSADN